MCFVASRDDHGSLVSLRFEPLSSARALAAAATAAAGPEEPSRGAAVTWWDSNDADHSCDIPAIVSFTQKPEAAGGAASVADASALGANASYDAYVEDAAYGVASNGVSEQQPLPEFFHDGDTSGSDRMATTSYVWPSSEVAREGVYPSVPPPASSGASMKSEPLSPMSVEGGVMLDDQSFLSFFNDALPDRLPTPPPPPDATLSVHSDGAPWSGDGGDVGGDGIVGSRGGCGSGGGDGCDGIPAACPELVPTFDTFYSMIPEECLPVDDVEMVHEQRLGCVYRVLERVGGETIDGRRRRGRKRVHPKPPARMLADLASIDSCAHILGGVASEATARQVEMRAEFAHLLATRDGLLASKATAAASSAVAAGRPKTNDWAQVLNAMSSWSAEPEKPAMDPAFC